MDFYYQNKLNYNLYLKKVLHMCVETQIKTTPPRQPDSAYYYTILPVRAHRERHVFVMLITFYVSSKSADNLYVDI